MKALRVYRHETNGMYYTCLLVIEVVCEGKPVKAAICRREKARYVSEEIVLIEQDYWKYYIEMIEKN